MHSNKYTLIYAAILSIITAVVLAVTSEGFRPAQEANIALDKKSNILKAVRLNLKDRSQIETTYSKEIKEIVVNADGEVLENEDVSQIVLKEEMAKKPQERRLPLYVYSSQSGKPYYILPMQGTGLWGPIWGYISLESDFNTVYGAYFDHKSETPGLGAEIAEAPFQNQFKGKKIMDNDSKFISVNVVKKSDKVTFGNENRVDAISGGTITSKGTNDMLKNWIGLYIPYIEKNKKS